MKELRLGILGMSEGNGHPYSWSAIFNGYDPEAMKTCPFPVIPDYLSKQRFPEDAIDGARVTHVWTQQRSISEHIAAASLIGTIVDNYEDMIGEVDAVLLARDDAENHYRMSVPFLDAGLPIYIDKPLATRTSEAERIYSRQRYEGQLFTCSALAFASEFSFSPSSMAELGSLKRVDAFIMKDWKKYGVHIIEPVLKIVGEQGSILSVKASEKDDVRNVAVTWESGLITSFTTMGKQESPIKIVFEGEDGSRELVLQDVFYAFRNALRTFVDSVRSHTPGVRKEFVMQVVNIIEQGSCDV